MPSSFKKPHSIQLVALGPVPEGRPRIKLATQSEVYRELRISESFHKSILDRFFSSVTYVWLDVGWM